MTKSQVNRLGERLRAPGSPGDENLLCLQEFRAGFDPAMVRAQALLADELGIEATSRLKTVNTIVEKLRREKTRLSEMQDIAGLRIVKEMLQTKQDSLVATIVTLFPGADVIDRRKMPSHGYRAVHVVATVEGHLIEMQVRTALQDAWAQAMEKLADRVGRGIRYGAPAPPEQEDRVAALILMSQLVAIREQHHDEIAMLRRTTPRPRDAPHGQRQVAIKQARLARWEQDQRLRAAELRTMLASFMEIE